MKFIATLLILALIVPSAFGGQENDTITVTKFQLQNMIVVDKILRAKYPQFRGFNGTAKKLEVLGIPGTRAKAEFTNIDWVQLEADQINQGLEEELIDVAILDLAIKEAEKDHTFKHLDKIKDGRKQVRDEKRQLRRK